MQKLTCALLVDDDQTTNYLNQLLLNRLGVTEKVLVALNGQEALDLLALHCQEATVECPALIFLDVKMPVMDGFAFLEAYSKLLLPHKVAIIIVMLTTSLHPQDVERVRKLNIAGFLNKPLTKEKVNEVLKNHFNRQLPEKQL
jgi:CheY-like chemotaxis protein